MQIISCQSTRAGVQCLGLAWPVGVDGSDPSFRILCKEFVVQPCPLVRILISDVPQGDEDVEQGSRHPKGFVTESSIYQQHGGFCNGQTFRVERQGHHVSVTPTRRIIPSIVDAVFCIRQKATDVLYLRVLTLSWLGNHRYSGVCPSKPSTLTFTASAMGQASADQSPSQFLQPIARHQ